MENVDEIDEFESHDEPAVGADANRLTSNSRSSTSNGAVSTTAATTSKSDKIFYCQHPMGPAYTFILPDLYQFADGFRQFLERDMIEMPTLKRLELSGKFLSWKK